MSETSACLLTWTPPSSVLISTCLSCPLPPFCTFTLHASKRRSAAKLAPVRKNAESLILRMLSTSTGNLNWPLETGAPRGHIGDADGKMPANGNFAEQGFDRSYLGDGRVGKRTHVILSLGEVCSKVWVSHCDN